MNRIKIILFVAILAVVGQTAFAEGMMPASEPSTPVESGASPKVEIFITSWCPYCRQLETFLKKNKILYTSYDIEQDAKGAEIFEKIGGAGVPMVRVGKEVIHGYDPDRILETFRA